MLVGISGTYRELNSGRLVEEPKEWMAEKSKDFFLAGAIGYECAWDFCDVNFDRPTDDGIPDFVVGAFTQTVTPDALPNINEFRLKSESVPERDPYTFAVNNAIQSIFDGELFEVNFTTQAEYNFCGDCDALMSAMLAENQGKWFSTLSFRNLRILSSSPECFLTVDKERRVRTDPIKGTETLSNRRGIQSEKNRAENVMIVDLMRNDLSRHCEPGSVVVSDLFREEVVSDLVHLVSTVEGNLREGTSPVELLCDCFPAGSITGAPKLRAIEIAAGLETQKRGFYCGTMFYSTPSGTLKSSVLIRTATLWSKNNNDDYSLKYGVGGAVVSDSIPDLEYDEAVDKLGPIQRLVNDGV